ncbi:flagellin N-terminal helical domain-containing protein [Paenibacillus hexagrammi]|uniref:Flagellin n=1 Tax=Paenibacillus hexagrammi TaxID=2908839 RepID=A0ABY3SGW2_9BACL|nr:flagellin [Paenibacillus sp. YPD9-1]UJF33224.1 flagellin [Paenibacillus sp. YPD9-1]
MRINTNVAALNTYNRLTANENATNKSLQKLSSGYRINTAADDAAGLAISEKMRSQIRGLDQATRNSQDGISMIQTAEGSLNETHDILQRMRELAVQSASDTNTDQDRNNLQDEMDQLTSEVDRIRNTTQFNTKNLLDGSLAAKASGVAGRDINKAMDTSTTTSDNLVDLKDINGNSLGIKSGDKVTVTYFSNGTFHSGSATTVGASTALSSLATSDFSFAVASSGGIYATASATGVSGAINGLTITVTDNSGNVKSVSTNALSSFTVERNAKNNVTKDNAATFQIGANAGQNINLSIDDMGATALGVKDLKIDNKTRANTAIRAIDEAIQKVSENRSKLGAYSNRLEHTINNLSTASENLTTSESRIRDVDMAKEQTKFTKNNILVQAATAMLAQANQQPQNVLSLLR